MKLYKCFLEAFWCWKQKLKLQLTSQIKSNDALTERIKSSHLPDKTVG